LLHAILDKLQGGQEWKMNQEHFGGGGDEPHISNITKSGSNLQENSMHFCYQNE